MDEENHQKIEKRLQQNQGNRRRRDRRDRLTLAPSMRAEGKGKRE